MSPALTRTLGGSRPRTAVTTPREDTSEREREIEKKSNILGGLAEEGPGEGRSSDWWSTQRSEACTLWEDCTPSRLWWKGHTGGSRHGWSWQGVNETSPRMCSESLQNLQRTVVGEAGTESTLSRGALSKNSFVVMGRGASIFARR